MSNFIQFLKELKITLPKWAKVILIVVIALLSITFFFTSCGTTTRIKAATSDGSSISIQVENKSDIDSETTVNPDIPITIDKIGSRSYRITYNNSFTSNFTKMIQSCKYNPKYGLKPVAKGKAVNLEEAISDFTVTGGQIMVTNGMETIDSVGSRVRDSFDALENFSMAAAMSAPDNNGIDNK